MRAFTVVAAPTLGGNGSVSVSRYAESDIERVCSRTVKQGIVGPPVVSRIGGSGKSARIDDAGAEPAQREGDASAPTERAKAYWIIR